MEDVSVCNVAVGAFVISSTVVDCVGGLSFLCKFNLNCVDF